MAAPKQSLRKLTDSEKKIHNLLRRKQVTVNDTNQLMKDERKRLMEIINETIKRADPVERDKILNKIEPIIDEQTIVDFWEYNHTRILYAITSMIKESGRMPTRSEIATRVQLSRTTVYKHLKEYATHPLYLEQLQKMRMLATNVLTKVYTAAMNDDIGAAKLYFNVMGMLQNGQGNTVQNNFIQINGIVVTQEAVKRLNPEQLLIIENVLKSALPQPEIYTAPLQDVSETTTDRS